MGVDQHIRTGKKPWGIFGSVGWRIGQKADGALVEVDLDGETFW